MSVHEGDKDRVEQTCVKPSNPIKSFVNNFTFWQATSLSRLEALNWIKQHQGQLIAAVVIFISGGIFFTQKARIFPGSKYRLFGKSSENEVHSVSRRDATSFSRLRGKWSKSDTSSNSSRLGSEDSTPFAGKLKYLGTSYVNFVTMRLRKGVR